LGSFDPGSLGQRAARHGTPATGQGSLDSESLNPPVAETGSLDSGSLDQRAASQETRSAELGSLDSGSLNPHASQQGSLNQPVAGTGSLWVRALLIHYG